MKPLFLPAALCFLIVHQPVLGSFEERPSSARSAGLGESGAALGGRGLGFDANPASLRAASRAEVLTGATRLLGFPEFSYQNIVLKWPTPRAGHWGLSSSRFGPDSYREEDCSLAQGVAPLPLWALGYGVRFQRLEMGRYGSFSAWGVDLGLLGRPTPRWGVGASAKNINGPRFRRLNEGPVRTFRLGAVFQPQAEFVTVLEAVKCGRAKPSGRAGQEVRLGPGLSLRFGVETSPSRFSAGVGVRVRGVQLDYAFLSHPYLNDQHHAGLSMVWGR